LYYFIRAMTKSGAESTDSVKVRTQPRIVEEVIVSVAAATEVRLAWKPAEDAAGYHVERAPVEVWSEDEILRLKKDTAPLKKPSVGAIKAIGSFTRLTKEPRTETIYVDTAVDLTKPQAVDHEALYRHRFRAEQLDAKGGAAADPTGG
jgi:hypothetical protein